MTELSTHQAVADDGTTIVGRVDGQGPPLVIVPALPSDGELEWGPVLAFLRDRFTCFVMDRGSRAKNAGSRDLSLERLVGDVVTFTDGVGEPVGLLGGSWSGMLALGAVRSTSMVRALAVWEPTVNEAASDNDRAHAAQTLGHVGRLVDEDRLVEAAKYWQAASGIMSEAELAAIPDEYYEASAPTFAIQFEEYRQAAKPGGPTTTEPSKLATIDVPVLLLHGAESVPWFVDGVHHVADHVPDATVHAIAGVGHTGGVTAPAPVADELTRFFTATLDAA